MLLFLLPLVLVLFVLLLLLFLLFFFWNRVSLPFLKSNRITEILGAKIWSNYLEKVKQLLRFLSFLTRKALIRSYKSTCQVYHFVHALVVVCNFVSSVTICGSTFFWGGGGGAIQNNLLQQPNHQWWHARWKLSCNMYTLHARFFACLALICVLSLCLLTKFLHWSSVRSLLRVRCWSGKLSATFLPAASFKGFF